MVLLGILESAGAESEGRPRRRGAPPRFAQPPRPPPGHSEISTPRSFLGVVRPPRLFIHLNWGADELAWAALNREQQSSLLAELRELPDIENYSIQEFLCRRSAEDPRTVLALLRQRIEQSSSGPTSKDLQPP